ncbi:RNA pseudouridylate synthase domain-containing protein, putative [Eimeria tenella]|uniref:RNA pseudouridylate synthase domain-containing protein, putative n=1 Tax=Eimeria tenella TaxID=5802 RepID=U6KSX8_EIMTE|nr:RNA pseudouridylate synthase domain-containing protein, putative [Eimeria tenella]CDJ41071.1 RNA pseudouridylate synthase domain-containing protein, putative [Eimeria tenella]|eukprot:XP_013231821.1 RNA pseudouridylate synthase domain-containing protein, putative [Eimeria tenella]
MARPQQSLSPKTNFPLLTAASARAGEVLDRQRNSDTIVAAAQALGDAVEAAGLSVFRIGSNRTESSKNQTPDSSQRVSRLLQGLCGCSWPSAQKMLRRKEAFVVTKDKNAEEHLQQIRDTKRRKPIPKGTLLEPGDCLYFPSTNSISDRSSPVYKQQQQQQQQKHRELLLFSDADFVVVNKPHGAPLKKLARELTALLEDTLGASVDAAEPLVPLTGHGHHCSGAVLLCRSRSLASTMRTSIIDGGFGAQKILTIVEGSPPGSRGVVKIPLRLDQTVGAALPCCTHLGGSAAVTQWTVLRTMKTSVDGYDAYEQPNKGLWGPMRSPIWNDRQRISVLLLETELRLSRDQIRAHCAFGLRCPVKGDQLYTRLLKMWQRAEQQQKCSSADAVPEKSDEMGKEQARERLALPLHVAQIKWRTLAGTEVTVSAPLGDSACAEFKACGLSCGVDSPKCLAL